MSGTLAGGQKAAIRNLERDPDFYSKIGHKGGLAKTPNGGFGAMTACNCLYIRGDHYKARCAGKKGGRKSRRKPIINT